MIRINNKLCQVSFSVRNEMGEIMLEGEALVSGVRAAIDAGNELARTGNFGWALDEGEKEIVRERLPYLPSRTSYNAAAAAYHLGKPHEMALMGLTLAAGCHAILQRHNKRYEAPLLLGDLPAKDREAVAASIAMQQTISEIMLSAEPPVLSRDIVE